MVLLEIRLEWRGARAVLCLVSKGRSSVEVEVIVVDSDLVLALLHAPEDERDTAKKESTTDATNDAANNLLVGLADAVPASTVSLLRSRKGGNQYLASGDGHRARAGFGHLGDLAVAQG